MKTLTHPSIVNKTYCRRFAFFMGTYAILNLAAIAGALDHLRAPGTWIFALIVAAQIVGQIWAMLVWMRDSDEFLRNLTAKRFVAGAGLSMAIVSTWGFLEVYAAAPGFPAVMYVPLFYAAFGFVSLFIRTTF